MSKYSDKMDRSVLEVLKFVPPKDTLQAASITCSRWLQSSEVNELWWTYCEENGIEAEHPRADFRDWALRIHLLVVVREQQVTVISAKTFSTQVFTLPATTSVNDVNAYCLISLHEVMCVGADNRPDVCTIDVKALTVNSLPPMKEGRVHPGIILLQGFVYVFGGGVRTSTKFSLKESEWRDIEQLIPENIDALTPAHYKGQIYLASERKIHVFRVLTEQYSTLSFLLATFWYYTLAFIDGEDLIVAQCGFLTRWNIETQKLTVTSIEPFGSGYYSNCPPVWCHGKLYSLHNNLPSIRGLLVFDSNAKTLASVPFPSAQK